MKKILILGALLLTSACAELNVIEQAKEIENTSFYQHWIHSYEEQNGQKTPNIFVPTGSKQFPPSRFRMELSFNQDGECSYKYLSPSDRHEIRNCVYTKIGNNVYLYDDQGKMLSHLNFTVLSITKDKMIMQYGIKMPESAKHTKEKKNGKSE